MEIVDQHVKQIMEGCKKRARDKGLVFDDETLEYIVTNRDLIELGPKVMIPTLYDYWVHDVRVLSEKGKYELYPNNPYETVINTRPAISFYNDNNPDWLNVMIFYHVLGHIDFFQNNLFFQHTWSYDFEGQALADKRLIARYRSEKGRWVDYVIEFARGIDNIVGYHDTVAENITPRTRRVDRIDYYFDVFLQQEKKAKTNAYLKEIDRYNALQKSGTYTDELFFVDVILKYPEFEALYQKKKGAKDNPRPDVMQYILEHSTFLKKDENTWMKSVIEVVRNTSLFFQPQIRTKIMNEGWASLWHETLFMGDDRIKGHEVSFAKVNAGVTAMPKVGLNPYALGMRLFYHIWEMEDRGCYSFDYFSLKDQVLRKQFDLERHTGRDIIFKIRENFCDFTFINRYIDQEFMDRHKLFVSGRRINRERKSVEYYIKSRKAEAYKEMIINTLYHPPRICVDHEKTLKGDLYLVHSFEGKPLKADFIENTMIGIEFLWGAPVRLETWEYIRSAVAPQAPANFWDPVAPKDLLKEEEGFTWKRFMYVMENRKLHKQEM
ncbi:SpoVR-like family protein [Desulforapulum autotrophicum HRM2]|uniref:SpoVR-like family protein n=1 Tax=Desulforapulum autotrophicum (strain ATCC 43914 / DSM 3382 / VKM B-1955 / HRM2) TaxID=177437 RepID=C0QJY3_DESAH|nr:SpoVR family protein [Desulforapulum autotrophicum]ACN16009.1 SpoVR-like family protein [Desulforapulum autotrophicum HRM2]